MTATERKSVFSPNVLALLDAKKESLQLEGADALNARTQQYLEVVGLLHQLKPSGITCDSKRKTCKLHI